MAIEGGGGGNGGGGGGGGGGGDPKGELFGDLWVLTRDLDPTDANGGGDGEPLLDENGQVIPVGRDPATGDIFPIFLQEVEEGEYEVPAESLPFVQEVELERANIIRAPDSVLEHALEEALDKIEAAETIDTDYAGRIIADGATIDSPLENAALYKYILTIGGHDNWVDVDTNAATDLPEKLADLMATEWDPTGLLGGTFSKFVPVSMDAVITAHTLLDINEVTGSGETLNVDYFSFTDGTNETFDYDRVAKYGDLWLQWFQDIDDDPSDLEIVQRTVLDAVWGSDGDGDGVNDIGSGVGWTDQYIVISADGLSYDLAAAPGAGINDWAQSVEDARAVIGVTHELIGATEIDGPTDNDAPVAADDAATTSEDVAVTIDVLANDEDPDDDPLVLSEFTQAGNGTVTEGADGALVYTPDADFNGEDSFTYEVSDGKGGRSTATVTVTVTPVADAPVAANDAANAVEDGAVAIDVLANDSDADGDALSVAAFTQGANGTVAAGADGTLVYTPDADFNGADIFSYDVSDGNGGTATATVSVTVAPVNDPPVAADDAATTDEDVAATINVLANDVDVDGDALTVASFTQGANGTVSTGAGGALIYTPDADFNGEDSFTYAISDGNGGASSATVTVTVAPVADAPVAADDAATSHLDEAVTINVLANDSDADDDVLTVAGIGAARHGTVAAGPGGALVYTPEAGFSGFDSFGYEVSDGAGGTASATAFVLVSPSPLDVDGRVVGTRGPDLLIGDGGDDRLRGLGGDDGIAGGVGADTLRGGPGADTLEGGDGDDRLLGGRGDDELLGDDGDDVLLGGDGDDLLVGGDGDDELRGGDGDDLLRGGAGDDLLLGDAGDDRLAGGDGADTLKGGAGADTLRGHGGDDRLHGNAGDDVLLGGAGDDVLRGGGGDDALSGGGGDDRLIGGRGDDVLDGGLGADLMRGGDGSDTFVFDSADAMVVDTIADFSLGQMDVIDVSGVDADAGTAADDAFSFLGYADFTGAGGELRAVDLGDAQRIEGDVDSDGVADFVIDVLGDTPAIVDWFAL